MNTGKKNLEASPKTAFENPVHTPLFCSKDQFQAGGTYWNPYVQMSSSKLTVTELGKPKKIYIYMDIHSKFLDLSRYFD